MKIKKITVDNGDSFEGTLEQFKDCFFSNADIDNVIDFCENVLKAKTIVIEFEI